MPRPFASMVELDSETRGRLEALVRAGCDRASAKDFSGIRVILPWIVP
jgi:hypothetical protein